MCPKSRCSQHPREQHDLEAPEASGFPPEGPEGQQRRHQPGPAETKKLGLSAKVRARTRQGLRWSGRQTRGRVSPASGRSGRRWGGQQYGRGSR